jgi:hypothetical protein
VAIINELDAVASAITAIYPNSKIMYEDNNPGSDTFVIRSDNNKFELETAASIKVGRLFQIVYYNDDMEAVLSALDAFGLRCMQNQSVIPLGDSLRYVRVNGFNYSYPVRLESNMFAAVGALDAEIRQARDLATYQKIMQVYTRLDLTV